MLVLETKMNTIIIFILTTVICSASETHAHQKAKDPSSHHGFVLVVALLSALVVIAVAMGVYFCRRWQEKKILEEAIRIGEKWAKCQADQLKTPEARGSLAVV